MRPIFSIGDSHSGFNFNNIPEVTPIGLGPITMYRVGRDRMEFKELSPGCIAIFCFGEIDVRTQLVNHTDDNTEDEVIKRLASSYIDTIILQRERDIIPVIMGITPPCKSTPLTPTSGTDEQRSRYGRKLNDYLKSICLEKGLHFLDIYDYYVDKDGNLIFELSDKANHIWNTKYVEEVFYKFLESQK